MEAHSCSKDTVTQFEQGDDCLPSEVKPVGGAGRIWLFISWPTFGDMK